MNEFENFISNLLFIRKKPNFLKVKNNNFKNLIIFYLNFEVDRNYTQVKITH